MRRAGLLDSRTEPVLDPAWRRGLTITVGVALGILAIGAGLMAIARAEGKAQSLGAGLVAIAAVPLAVIMVVAVFVLAKHWIAADRARDDASVDENAPSSRFRHAASIVGVGAVGELPTLLWPRALVRMLRHYSADVRRAALEYDGIPGARLVALARNDEDARIRMRAWDRLRPTMTQSTCIELVASKHADIRALAIGSEMSPRGRARRLAGFDPDAHVRAQAWARLGPALDRWSCFRLLRSPHRDVRERIAQSGKLRDEEILAFDAGVKLGWKGRLLRFIHRGADTGGP